MDREVSNFFDVIDGVIRSVDTISSAQYESNYKRIILFSIMDMLSKAVYGNRFTSHRKKFVAFISEFGAWRHANRISLQQLLLILQRYPVKELERLRILAQERLSGWPRSQPIPLDHDPGFTELTQYWPSGYKINNTITLEYFKHINLFYSLRNSYVHENRPLGYAFELFEEKSPHYISRGVLRRDENGKLVDLPHEAFELVHPTSFYFELISNSLPRMKDFFIRNSINPYDNFTFGSEWLDVN